MDPPTEPLSVLFEDDHVLAVDKPSGQLVHRGMGRDPSTLVDAVRSYLASTPHPVHRIDRSTSGVVLFAKTPACAHELAEQFVSERVAKRYVALVRGRPADRVDVDHPIPRGENEPRVPARTSFVRIDSSDAGSVDGVHALVLSLLVATPHTGRFHQVRRHAKHLGHPLVGDANYGRGEINRYVRERYGFARLALHSRSIAFDHPRTGARVQVDSPVAADFVRLLETLGIDYRERL